MLCSRYNKGGIKINTPALFRKRYIPQETVHLKRDEIVDISDKTIVTKWCVLKPRSDFYFGASCYFLKEGIKVSKLFDKNMKFVYYYCDIIKTEYMEKENQYIFHDLLLDVIIDINGFVKVVDVCEIPVALDEGLITVDDAKTALRSLDFLLTEIYENRFGKWTVYVDEVLRE